MANQKCPKCGANVPVTRDWGTAALSIFSTAPAVRDMATQARCPNCGHVFADGEIRYRQSTGSRGLLILLALVVACLLVWSVY